MVYLLPLPPIRRRTCCRLDVSRPSSHNVVTTHTSRPCYRNGDGPPLSGSATPRVRYSQGPPLQGSATPRVRHSRVRHSQGPPHPGCAIICGIQTFRSPYPFSITSRCRELKEN